MAGMECLNSKRKAADAALDDGRLSDGDNDVAVDAGTPGPPEIAAAQEQQAPAPAPRQPTTKVIMSQAWIDSILADEIKPLPLNEELLRDPKLAAIFQSHEQSRASFAEYQNAIRRELETKGFVEIDDDYDEMCELLHAVSTAAFYGREEEEKEAMAKLAALRRR
ncbi:hypothetical protein BDA96_05G201700 [Sorghum bicolor]|uniref:Uncharacterized protein n=1 Tax=Sorghum bicolor TaxID=4558 RepID=A0A921QZ29_SORBI|nr:hypothetical protein BDA96_05G201700 [Sorghum bicolor]